MKIGEKIYLLRKKQNLSQEQLAIKLSVSRQSISKWELGDALPDLNNVLQLSKLFKVSLEYLIDDLIDIETKDNLSINCAPSKDYVVKIMRSSLLTIILKLILIALFVTTFFAIVHSVLHLANIEFTHKIWQFTLGYGMTTIKLWILALIQFIIYSILKKIIERSKAF